MLKFYLLAATILAGGKKRGGKKGERGGGGRKRNDECTVACCSPVNLEPPSSRSSSSLSTAHRHRSRFVRARMRLFLELLRGRETNARDYQKKYIVRICMPSTINALTLEYFSSSFLVFLHQFSKTWEN